MIDLTFVVDNSVNCTKFYSIKKLFDNYYNFFTSYYFFKDFTNLSRPDKDTSVLIDFLKKKYLFIFNLILRNEGNYENDLIDFYHNFSQFGFTYNKSDLDLVEKIIKSFFDYFATIKEQNILFLDDFIDCDFFYQFDLNLVKVEDIEEKLHDDIPLIQDYKELNDFICKLRGKTEIVISDQHLSFMVNKILKKNGYIQIENCCSYLQKIAELFKFVVTIFDFQDKKQDVLTLFVIFKNFWIFFKDINESSDLNKIEIILRENYDKICGKDILKSRDLFKNIIKNDLLYSVFFINFELFFNSYLELLRSRYESFSDYIVTIFGDKNEFSFIIEDLIGLFCRNKKILFGSKALKLDLIFKADNKNYEVFYNQVCESLFIISSNPTNNNFTNKIILLHKEDRSDSVHYNDYNKILYCIDVNDKSDNKTLPIKDKNYSQLKSDQFFDIIAKELSPKKINTLFGNPYDFYLNYYLKLKKVDYDLSIDRLFGIHIHRIVDIYSRSNDNSMECFWRDVSSYFLSNNFDLNFFTKDLLFYSKIDQAGMVVSDLFNNSLLFNSKIFNEIQLICELSSSKIKCIVDSLRVNNDKRYIVVIDYKSSPANSIEKELRGDGVQLLFANYILNEKEDISELSQMKISDILLYYIDLSGREVFSVDYKYSSSDLAVYFKNQINKIINIVKNSGFIRLYNIDNLNSKRYKYINQIFRLDFKFDF